MSIRHAPFVYMLLRATASLFVAVVYTVELIYQAQYVGLTPFQLILAGSVNQFIGLVSDAPTGSFADMYSRRWAIILGVGITGCGFLLEGAISTFAAIIGAQVLWGFGAALMNGADAAWIADEVGAEHVGRLYLRSTQLGWLCTLPGIALGAGLGMVRLNIPLLIGGGGYLALAILLVGIMPERHHAPAIYTYQSPWRLFHQTLTSGIQVIRVHSVLLKLVIIGAFVTIAEESFGRLWQYDLLHTIAFPLEKSVPLMTWFGVMECGIALTSILGIEIIQRCVDMTNHHSIAVGLLFTTGGSMCAMICFACTHQFAITVVTLWLLTTSSGPGIPLTQAWMTREVPEHIRATVFSLKTQISSLAGIIGSICIGIIATAFSTQLAILISAFLFIPALFLYLSISRGT